MPDDEFSKQAGRAFQNVTIGAAGLVGGPAGVALTVGASALFNIFDAVASRNDEAFRDARIGVVEDEIRRVAEEVRKIQAARADAGKPVDAPDPLTQGALFSEFAESVASAATPEKRTALVHAAARQFDPDIGAAPVRKHWFNEVRKLSDMEVFAIRTLAREGGIIFASTKAHSRRKRDVPGLVLPLSDDEHVALRETVLRLDSESSLVASPPPTQGRATRYTLSYSGLILARYIDDYTPEPAEDE